ncbi:hypothetical protein [Streptomyces sp. NPDC096339]|uniref:hypothetical protein n=1 Tax=Streptomyces sp. NPDC096339 TaxID=3366086 RepID=UPI003824C2FB
MRNRTPRITVSLAFLALTACTPAADRTPDADTTTGAQVPVQNRDAGCGTAIAGPFSDGGGLKLAITATARTGDTLTASWSLTSPHPDHAITIPLTPTRPTAFLLRDGKVVGKKAVAEAKPEAGLQVHPVGKTPYTGTSVINDLCPGTTWPDITANPVRYTVTVIASDPAKRPTAKEVEATRPSLLPDPVLQAFQPLPAA